MALQEIEDFVRQKVEVEKCTHKQLSSHLQQCYPGEKGFSLRSIERFCGEKGIRKVCACTGSRFQYHAVALANSYIRTYS